MRESEKEKRGDFLKRHNGFFTTVLVSHRRAFVAGYRRLCPSGSNRFTVIGSLTVRCVLLFISWFMSLSHVVDERNGIPFPLFLLIMSDKFVNSYKRLLWESTMLRLISL